MKVKYFGNSCFLFSTKDTKLATNPKDKGARFNLEKINPDIIVKSHKEDLKDAKAYYVIESPGEYEIKDIFVYGFLSSERTKENTADIYMFDINSMHIGYIDRKVESIKQSIIKEMGIVNILFISLADDAGMKMTKLSDLVNKIEPQIVIPMDYTKENLEKFAKIQGVKGLEEESSLNIKRTDFSEEDMPLRIIVLKK